MRLSIPFGAYSPDHAQHMTDGLMTCDGVYASTNGYRPVKAFSEIADALAGTFKGGAAFVASDGAARMLAGDGTDLYILSSGAWSSVLGSLTVEDRWRFTQFGDDIICTNGGAPVAYDLVAGTAGNLAGSPPVADLCATVRDFVLLGRTSGSNQLVRSCAQGDAETWATGSGDGADEIPLYSGGKLMGMAGGEYGLLIQRFAVKRMTYTGDNASPWQIDEISTNYGCIAEGSIATAGRMTFFYSDRGFVVCDGNDVRPIGVERVDATFRALYSDGALDDMWSAIDPVRTLVVWSMPGKLWFYNWTLDRWSTASVPTAAVFNSFSESIGIEALDALYADVDSVPYLVDDPRFSGGTPRLTVVNLDGSYGVLSGSNLSAMLELPFIEMVAGRTARLQRVRPITDATSGVSLVTHARRRLGDESFDVEFSQLHDNGDMPVRIAGRSIRLKLVIDAGSTWDYAQSLECEMAAGGRG